LSGQARKQDQISRVIGIFLDAAALTEFAVGADVKAAGALQNRSGRGSGSFPKFQSDR
jgi:hypothetical protein